MELIRMQSINPHNIQLYLNSKSNFMKTIKFLAVALPLCFLVACGGKKETEGKEKEEVAERSIEIPVSDITLEGEGAEYFELEGESITITGAPGSFNNEVVTELSVKPLKAVKTLSYFVKPNGYPFTLTVFDDNDEELGHLTYYSSDDLKKLEEEMRNGTNNPVKIKLTKSMNANDYNKFFDNAKSAKSEVAIKFHLTSDDVESSSSSSSSYDESDDSDDESDDENVVQSSGSNNWDSLLNDYEAAVMKMASVAKKAAKNDPSALAEYAVISTECVDIYSRISREKSQMTSAQLARLNKIYANYNRAISSIR